MQTTSETILTKYGEVTVETGPCAVEDCDDEYPLTYLTTLLIIPLEELIGETKSSQVHATTAQVCLECAERLTGVGKAKPAEQIVGFGERLTDIGDEFEVMTRTDRVLTGAGEENITVDVVECASCAESDSEDPVWSINESVAVWVPTGDGIADKIVGETVEGRDRMVYREGVNLSTVRVHDATVTTACMDCITTIEGLTETSIFSDDSETDDSSDDVGGTIYEYETDEPRLSISPFSWTTVARHNIRRVFCLLTAIFLTYGVPIVDSMFASSIPSIVMGAVIVGFICWALL